MDSDRFDALSRVIGSRRLLVSGLLAGAIGALTGGDALAHNAVPACRRIKDPKKKKACLRKARRHNRTCHAQPVDVTCAGRCGLWNNNCGHAVACRCPGGHTCFNNGSCGQICDPGGCPPGATCSQPAVEGLSYCVPAGQTCDDVPQVCSSSDQCALGWFCQSNTCFGPPNNRCTQLV